MEVPLDPATLTLILTIISTILGIVAAKFKVQHTAATSALTYTQSKMAQGDELLKQIIKANEDNNITVDEFNGIVSAAKTFVTK